MLQRISWIFSLALGVVVVVVEIEDLTGAEEERLELGPWRALKLGFWGLGILEFGVLGETLLGVYVNRRWVLEKSQK